MVLQRYWQPLTRTVSWLRTETLHSFLKVIGETESAQEMVGCDRSLRLVVVLQSTQEIGVGAVVRGDRWEAEVE